VKDVPIDALRTIFKAAPFIASLGIELESVSEGTCCTSLQVRREHLQQNGVVHAGVIATLADHTAGGAASSVLPQGSYPLTAEFKINLLRPASGQKLRCVSRVLKPGRNLVVAESEVFSDSDDCAVLSAKAMVTLAVISKSWTPDA
jgi:uncharacterized protein (TIGR00369 family)